MTTVGRVERRIYRVEGFRAEVQHLDGRNVRSDREGMPAWPFERGAKDSWTVADWRRERFNAVYPGFDVDVLDGGRNPVPGHTRLKTVRDTYDD